MTFSILVITVSKIEGGKSNAKVGDIREILSKLSVLMIENPETILTLIENGKRAVNRKKSNSSRQSGESRIIG